MAINKVEYGGKTLIDLTNDSVTPETLAEGTTAHDASGEPIVGIVPRAEGVTSFDADDYFIKGETLTAIADAIRDNSPDSWAGCDITPEQMPDTIGDVYNEGYGYGYDDAMFENRITDLKGTVWEIPAGWSAPAGYGQFEINGNITRPGTSYSYPKVTKVDLGYGVNNILKENSIRIDANVNKSYVFPSNMTWCFEIFGGADATNPPLIDWLYEFGKLQSKKTYGEGYDTGYNDGFDEGYNDGLYKGVCSGVNGYLYEGTVPAMIQGLMSDQMDDEGMFTPSVYNQELCGKSYSFSSFVEEEVVASSSDFTLSILNNTDCGVDLYVRAVCNYNGGSEQEEFWVYAAAQGDGSNSVSLGEGYSGHDWTYEILGVWFYYEWY
jgi:hypothetical protein